MQKLLLCQYLHILFWGSLLLVLVWVRWWWCCLVLVGWFGGWTFIFFSPQEIKWELRSPILASWTFSGHFGPHAYRRHTPVWRQWERVIKGKSWDGLGTLWVPQVVQVSRRETQRKKRDPVCSLPVDTFRALTSVCTALFQHYMLAQRSETHFPQRIFSSAGTCT